ncbi:hypothetical protein [Desulfosporosinus sp. SB140]|uniref:hypothetical protein n=1 Tax=Desulfosporosinus paludis TaxID=3115649 RepID=UPI00388D1D80
MVFLNEKVFNDSSNPLNVISVLSTVIKFNSFTTSQTSKVLWTPSIGQSINLTAINISAAVGTKISFQRAGNAVFLVVLLNTSISLYNANYCSPVRFDKNESISITSSFTLTSGEYDITLIGYEN